MLRDHVIRAALQIPINMAAWLLGIAWTLALHRLSINQHTRSALILYGIAGLCMAATVAIITEQE